MSRIAITTIVLFLFVISACSQDPLRKLISDADTVGAAQILDIKKEVQSDKNVNGGTLILASVSVPFEMTREQIRPTLLKGIQRVYEASRQCEWIVVWLDPEGSSGSDLSLGRAEFTGDKIVLSILVPSKKTIAKVASDPSLEPLLPLNKETYRTAAEICRRYYKLNVAMMDKPYEERQKLIFKRIGAELGVGAAKVVEIKQRAQRYYGTAWEPEDHETIRQTS